MNEKINFIELILKQKKYNNILEDKTKIDKLINELISKMDNHLYRIEIIEAMKNGRGKSIRYSNTLKTDMLYSTKKVGSIVVRLAKPLDEVSKTLHELRWMIIVLGIVIAIISFLAIIFISRKLTRSINQTLEFASHFSSGDFSKRIKNYSDDEIGTLQKSLNKLANTIVEKINNLEFEQEKLQVTIESIRDGIVVIDNNKKIIIANRSFYDFADIDESSFDGYFYEYIRNSSLNSKIEETLDCGKTIVWEEELNFNKYFEISIDTIQDKKIIHGIILVLRDITEKKKIEQIKTDLVGNMSHELKTPITILKGYIETIQNSLNDRKMTKKFLDKALINVDRQNELINDILKLNRLETVVEFQTEKMYLSEIISSCVEILHPKAINKKIEINIKNKGIEESFLGNRFLAEEVFFNLIVNAINYNRLNGKISILIDNSEEVMSIEISDTGIGIPEESIDRIFERFYRVDKGRTRSTGGTGLGLAIVKHATELLGWKIKVKSNNSGTTFVINIYS